MYMRTCIANGSSENKTSGDSIDSIVESISNQHWESQPKETTALGMQVTLPTWTAHPSNKTRKVLSPLMLCAKSDKKKEPQQLKVWNRTSTTRQSWPVYRKPTPTREKSSIQKESAWPTEWAKLLELDKTCRSQASPQKACITKLYEPTMVVTQNSVLAGKRLPYRVCLFVWRFAVSFN